MRRCYIVSYDIADAKRLRHVYKTMQGYGEHLQFSVFRVEISEMELIRMKSDLEKLIHNKKDQVLIIDLGPVPGRADTCFSSLGIPYQPPERRLNIF